jgi:glyoxylase-like metal-dependent hydrolase (beta-lactamase superfamily II)
MPRPRTKMRWAAAAGAAFAGATFAGATLSGAVATATSVDTHERSITKLGEGVYVIRHKDAPDEFPQGNTTVIIGERVVFVVDACYLPSTARLDIAQIRQWTDKPVRYLLNTHWHYDHTRGNATYAEAFPSLSVVAHVETRRMMERRDTQYPVHYAERHDALKRQIDSGKGTEGKARSEKERADLAKTWAGQAEVLHEYEGYVDRLPDLTFRDELDVDLGDREVQVRFLGRGNTAGDAVVYLPKEKIVLTGDILVHPVPYCFGGYPSDWIVTLQKLDALGAEVIVPGHGEIQHDDAYLRRVVALLDKVVSRVREELTRGPQTKLEALRTAIDLSIERKEFAGDDKDSQDLFDQSTGVLIETCRREEVAR